ncbi:MAG: 7-cyano-7-deazaguanine synthase [Nitrososphaera sp.]
MSRPKTVCVISGGLDSVCYAAILSKSSSQLFTITFDYAQKASPEISRARYFSKLIGAQASRIVDISFMKSLYGNSNALTSRDITIGPAFKNQLVVPVRNAVFLTIAAAWAISIGASKLAYGAHLGDVPHYPDCRPEFASSLQETLNLAEADSISSGRRERLELVSPAIEGLDKTRLLVSGHEILGDKVFRAWSCYTPGVTRGNRLLHCGKCESCISRKKAFLDAVIQDKTGYADR